MKYFVDNRIFLVLYDRKTLVSTIRCFFVCTWGNNKGNIRMMNKTSCDHSM